MTAEKVPKLPAEVTVELIGACPPKKIRVRVNDRGPFAVDRQGKPLRPLQPHPSRVIDLTPAAFKELAGDLGRGVIPVKVTVP